MNFFHTRISEEAIALVTETLRTGFVSEGTRVHQFEDELRKALDVVNPIALNSGTSALHLGLTVAGVKPGDEVIIPAQTFVATGLAVLMCGAKVVFADIQKTTGNIDPTSVLTKITKRTKALIPVHWAGYPCDMNELNAIASNAGIAVIEDAAHALGATYMDRAIGSISRFTIFSFQAIKHLTTGDGGALCCMSTADADAALRLRWFGIDRAKHQPSLLGERKYVLQELGFKYHMNDIAAAIGLGNLKGFHEALARHREIDENYSSALREVAGITLLDRNPDRHSSCWTFTMLVQNREDFVRALKSRGIPTNVVHQRIDLNPIFGPPCLDLQNQDFFDRFQIALPIHVGCSDDDISHVIEAIKMGW